MAIYSLLFSPFSSLNRVMLVHEDEICLGVLYVHLSSAAFLEHTFDLFQ